MSYTKKRHSPKEPCPICGGHSRYKSGLGKRCWGFIFPDGAVVCTREEYSGDRVFNNSVNGYIHREESEQEVKRKIENGRKKKDYDLIGFGHSIDEVRNGWRESDLNDFKGGVPKYIINRGITLKVCKEYELGYDERAPRYNEDTDKTAYDAIRVIFPLRDKNNVLHGVLGRSVKNKWKPKYWVYYGTHKKLHLYGIDKLEFGGDERWREWIIICEGPMDVLKMRTYGITNSVAIMGSEISDEQICLIRELNRTVGLMLDDDKAGRKGCQRAEKYLKGFLTIMRIVPRDGEAGDAGGLNSAGLMKVMNSAKRIRSTRVN